MRNDAIAGQGGIGKTVRNGVIAWVLRSPAAHGQGAPESEARQPDADAEPDRQPAGYLFEVIRVLQEHEGVQADVRFKRRPAEAAMVR